ncbi:MAG: uracil-DNA glycosylase [Pseudomonadota bacterium]
MSLDRTERLRELGLLPAWRLRAPGPGAQATEAPDDEADGAVPEAIDRPLAQVAVPRSAASSPCGLDWPQLEAAIRACTCCDLHQSRTQGVPGVGDRNADWLIVGEAPGAEEDRQGEPFVGQAGKLLDAMLAAIGQRRGRNVYIANVLKSRPPGNRDPRPEEVAACLPYLERQIDLIQPKIIIALGRFAAQSLLLTDTSITRLRGKVHEYRGVPLVVTYHPAYLLRNPADKAKVWEDLVLARSTLAGVVSG